MWIKECKGEIITEKHVADVHFGGILVAGRGVDVEVARVDESRVLVVATPEVAERHVIDEAITDIRTSPGLETRGVLAVKHPKVLDNDVLDERHLTLVLAERANGLTVGA
jgi:phytoene dehydrogenase-like protein